MSGKRFTRNQAGIASFMFTVVMMIIISLIVISFAQVARRGMRQALDSQLSSQAYYAAESGINDAIFALSQLRAQSVTELDKKSCAPSTAYTTVLGNRKPIIDDAGNSDPNDDVKYTCMKVDTKPERLVQGMLSQGHSTVFNLEVPAASSWSRLGVYWQVPEGADASAAGCPLKSATTGYFTPVQTWTQDCKYAALRIDIVPTKGAALSRQGLTSGTMTFYAMPTRDVYTGTVDPNYWSSTTTQTSFPAAPYRLDGAVQQGIRAGAGCWSDQRMCVLDITGLASSDCPCAMRVTSLYNSAKNVGIWNLGDSGFINGQAVIDVTGKAVDVVRRVQVRVPLSGYSGDFSDYALATREPLCKQFITGNNVWQDVGCPADVAAEALVGGSNTVFGTTPGTGVDP